MGFLYKVIKDKKTIMQTTSESCIYDKEIEKSLKKAGYKIQNSNSKKVERNK